MEGVVPNELTAIPREMPTQHTALSIILQLHQPGDVAKKQVGI